MTVVPSAASALISARTSRVPCGSRPLVGSSRISRSRGASRAAARAGAGACPASTRGSACPPRPAGRPVPARVRSARRRRAADRRCGRPRRAGAGCPARTGTGGTPGPRPARRPGAGPGRRPAGIGCAEQRVAARRSAGSARAASGWSWSCRSRWGRGTRTPLPRGTARSMPSTATWRPNRLVSPGWLTARSASAAGHLRRLRGRVGGGLRRAGPGGPRRRRIRPSSVISTLNRRLVSRWPLPQAPLTAGSALRRRPASGLLGVTPAGRPAAGQRREPWSSRCQRSRRAAARRLGPATPGWSRRRVADSVVGCPRRPSRRAAG